MFDIDTVLDIVGLEQFAEAVQNDVPWHDILTDEQISALADAMHTVADIYFVDETVFDTFTTSYAVIECGCGETFRHRLLSKAHAAHDEHAGIQPHNWHITADMLSN